MKKFLITLIVAVLVFSGTYIFFTYYLDILDANNFKEEIQGVELGEGNVIEQVVDEEIFFLLAGVDELVNYGAGVRTDTLMLIKADLATGEVDLVSIPRDTKVLILGEWDKINHAHAYGGMTLTLRTIRDWMGIDLDYYVKVDFEAVVEIVDAMGGLYVDVPMDIYHPSYNIDLQEGRQLLNGEEVLYVARYREGYQSGDIGRVEMQQHIIKELIRQALSIENIPKLGSFVQTYFNRVDTNITIGMVLDLIPLAGSIDTENIQGYTIPGYEAREDGISYYFYDEEGTQRLVDELFYDYKLKEMGE